MPKKYKRVLKILLILITTLLIVSINIISKSAQQVDVNKVIKTEWAKYIDQRRF